MVTQDFEMNLPNMNANLDYMISKSFGKDLNLLLFPILTVKCNNVDLGFEET